MKLENQVIGFAKCIDEKLYVTIGKIYKINCFDKKHHIVIKDDDGDRRWINANYFKIAKTEEELMEPVMFVCEECADVKCRTEIKIKSGWSAVQPKICIQGNCGHNWKKVEN